MDNLFAGPGEKSLSGTACAGFSTLEAKLAALPMMVVLSVENFIPESGENPVLSTAKAIRRAKEILGDKEAHVTLYVDKEKKRRERG